MPSDGIVPVERTKLDRHVGFPRAALHAHLHHGQNGPVQDQVVHFLQHGRFQPRSRRRGWRSDTHERELSSLPLWLVWTGGILAGWAVLSLTLWPIWKRYWRNRAQRLIERLNETLSSSAFRLTRWRDADALIGRLVADPRVLDADRGRAQRPPANRRPPS